jgi:hypothetical protein
MEDHWMRKFDRSDGRITDELAPSEEIGEEI